MTIAASAVRLAAVALMLAAAGCGSARHPPKPRPPVSPAAAKAAEQAAERRNASYERPPAAVVAAAGPTAPERDAPARAALLRAAADLQAYRRRHRTYAIGPVGNLHRLDPRTALVDFVDARETSFFIAVDPPTTTRIWRYDDDNGAIDRVGCLPGGSGCAGVTHW